jgi:hypothetical protein
MLLPDLVLPSRVNQTWQYSGMDSPELCANPDHFQSYPHHITYQYNSRGFRDSEWPHDLEHAIWCMGDSFTVGLGVPEYLTWPTMLGNKLHQHTINISMDGASNQWISRRACDIEREIKPRVMIIQWSYLHRRESTVQDIQQKQLLDLYQGIRDEKWPDISSIRDFESLPQTIQNEVNSTSCHPDYLQFWFQANDESRRLHHSHTTPDQDVDKTLACIEKTRELCCRVIHTFVPNFDTVDTQANERFQQELHKMNIEFLPQTAVLDLARDGHHYGAATVNRLTDQLVAVLQRQ